MRRVIIIRKDLNLSPGKLMAMSMHLAEAYWTNLIKKCYNQEYKDGLVENFDGGCRFAIEANDDIWEEYVNGIFTKTICECKNLNQLKTKIAPVIEELKLVEGVDWGYINDSCKTVLTPENPDGTCTIGVWFKPMKDDDAHKISKKFKLYGAFD